MADLEGGIFCVLGLGGIYSQEKKQLAGRAPCWFEQLLAAPPAKRWGESEEHRPEGMEVGGIKKIRINWTEVDR